MRLQRYSMGEYNCYYEDDEAGDMCKSWEVECLEAQHAAVCAILKSVSDSARKTYVRVYTDETGEWSNRYAYSVTAEAIQQLRQYLESTTTTNGEQP